MKRQKIFIFRYEFVRILMIVFANKSHTRTLYRILFVIRLRVLYYINFNVTTIISFIPDEILLLHRRLHFIEIFITSMYKKIGFIFLQLKWEI